MPPSSPPRLPSQPKASPFSPPTSSFKPQLLPTSPVFGGLSSTLLRSPPDKHFPGADSSPQRETRLKRRESEEELNVIAVPETIEEESQGHDIQDVAPAIAKGEPTSEDQVLVAEDAFLSDETVSRGIRPKRRFMSYFLRLVYLCFGITACYSIVYFKLESASIGYCDPGSDTNAALEQLKSQRVAIEACNGGNRTYLDQLRLSIDHSTESLEDGEALCPLGPPIPGFHPERCTPCPDHATCTQFGVTCDPGFILHSPPLLFFLPPSASPRSNSLSLSSSPSALIWRLLSEALDGLPGLGSIALPPRCIEDPKRKRHIGALGKAMESLLGRERGRRLCSGKTNEPAQEMDGGEAKKWGYELEGLRDLMRKKAPVSWLLLCYTTLTLLEASSS